MARDASTQAARLVERVDARWDRAQVERSLTGLHRRRAAQRARRVLVGGGAAVLIALLGVGVWSGWGGEGSTHRAIADASPADGAPIELADGTRVIPSGDALAVVEYVSDERVAVRVDRGAVRFEVTPRPARVFEVHVGSVTVSVLGTIFTVEARPDDHAHVSVERGRVRAAWAAGSIELGAGEEALVPRPVSAPSNAAELGDEVVGDSTLGDTTLAEPALVAEPGDRPVPTRHAASPSAESGDWRTLARAERYDDAYVSLHLASSDAVSDRVEDLLLAADVARLSGHPSDALPYLERVLGDHASDPRAVLASFTRARVLAQLGRHAAAADEFEHALLREPNGSLSEDALARAALARRAAGDTARAQALVDRYLSAYPDGRWAGRLRASEAGPK